MFSLRSSIKNGCVQSSLHTAYARRFFCSLSVTLYVSSLVLYVLTSGGSLSDPSQLFYLLKQAFTHVWLSTFMLLVVCQRYVPFLFRLLYAILQLIAGVFISYVILYDYNILHAFQNFLFTNKEESGEFLKSVPVFCHLITFFFFASSFYTLRISRRYKMSKEKGFSAFYAFLLLASLFLGVEKPFRCWLQKEDIPVSQSKNAYIRLVGTGMDLYTFYKAISTANHANAEWHILGQTSNYDDYILVIGESASADYMHLYGYPEKNTPFVDSIKGLRVCKNYYASATHTQDAIESSFTMARSANPNPANTIITLANSADFETYWYSNQTRSGFYSSSATSIANAASECVFLDEITKKESNYDAALLPLVKKTLISPTTKKRLIVLHLIGSHADFQQRLEKPLYIKRGNNDLSAYLQTLAQTDDLLRELYHISLSTGRKFSIIYTSDHGLARSGNTLLHGRSQTSIHIPFLMLGSDLSERQVFYSKKYAIHFMHGFSEWIGLQTKELHNDYSFWKYHPLDTTKKNVIKNAYEDPTDGSSFPKDELLGL